MSLIEWRPEFELGVPAIDREHRELVELINSVHGALAEEDRAASVMELLGDLYARISAHFALEERMMREQGYDEYAEHKDDHERLLDEIRDLMDDYEDGVALDLEGFSAALDAWFSEHFRTRDARLHRKLG